MKALLFDVFGSCVDFRSSITREMRALAHTKGFPVNAGKFADAWRAGYRPAMDRVARGELGWTRIDDLHRMILDELLVKFQMTGLTEEEKAELNRAWHRLIPWPDTVRDLKRLKKRHIIATLSNGNVALPVNMARYAGLPWDCIFSAETFHHYKPDPETYLGAADQLGLRPQDRFRAAPARSSPLTLTISTTWPTRSAADHRSQLHQWASRSARTNSSVLAVALRRVLRNLSILAAARPRPRRCSSLLTASLISRLRSPWGIFCNSSQTE